MDSRERHARLKQLVETMPNLRYGTVDMPMQTWLAKAHATVIDPNDRHDIADDVILKDAIPRVKEGDDSLGIRATAASKIISIVLRKLEYLEQEVAPGTSGSFIAVGSAFDAFRAVTSVLAKAKSEILIVDPYFDAKVLEVFAPGAPEGISLRLLADPATMKLDFKPATQSWISQHGKARPLEARTSTPRALHDRAIFVDGTRAWALTQSFNHFAERSPASIVEVGDIASLKIAAYEAIWQTATPLA
jgi:hypothetical protein